jgi:hypothetical protein
VPVLVFLSVGLPRSASRQHQTEHHGRSIHSPPHGSDKTRSLPSLVQATYAFQTGQLF